VIDKRLSCPFIDCRWTLASTSTTSRTAVAFHSLAMLAAATLLWLAMKTVCHLGDYFTASLTLLPSSSHERFYLDKSILLRQAESTGVAAMPRAGVNKAVVQIAREALLARGVHPSVDAIRVELGNTGSKTTIQRYLKELTTADLPTAVSALSDELVHYVEIVAKRLLEETRLRNATELPQADEAGRQLTPTEAQSQELIANLQKQLADQRTALENVNRQKISLEHQCTALQQMLSQKEITNHALSERNGHLEALLDQERDQPHLPAVLNHQHDEQQIQQLKEEQQSLKASLLQTQRELIGLYREQKQLLAESHLKTQQTLPDGQQNQQNEGVWDQQA